MIAGALAAALSLGATIQDPLVTLLTGASVKVIDVASDRTPGRRGMVTKGLMFDSCTLGLQYSPAGTGPKRVPLRDLRILIGDNDMAIKIALTTKPEEEITFTVGRDRYADGILLLVRRAEACGYKLDGPPPPITARP